MLDGVKHRFMKNTLPWYLKIFAVLLLVISSLVFRSQNVDYHSRGAPFPFLVITPTTAFVGPPRFWKMRNRYDVNYEALLGDAGLSFLALSAFQRRRSAGWTSKSVANG